MAGPHPVTCPSGLAVEVRGLKAKEANMLAEQGSRGGVSAFDSLLKSCWIATTATGVYSVAPDGALNWSDVLVGDRFAVLLGIRIATHGPEYHFPVRCGACGNRYEWEINLNDLPTKPFPAASLAAFTNGNKLATTLEDGRPVTFRLLTGAGEVQVARLLKQARATAVTSALAARILAIHDVAEEDKMGFLEDLELSAVTDLLAKFEEADGGVETSIQVTCTSPACGNEEAKALPFDRTFWMPTKRTR